MAEGEQRPIKEENVDEVKVEPINIQEEDEDGPNSLDLIEENLWIGSVSAATDLELIKSKNIVRILTIDIWPLPRKITDFNNIKIMCIPVTDLPSEDLISYFESSYHFIVNGLREGAVLVHCYQGVSRSAAIVLAYLMKKYTLKFAEAYDMIKSKRKLVHPNPGFTAQLELYERMEYTIEKTNLQYRMFRLYIASDRVRSTKYLPPGCVDVIKPDPHLITDNPDPVLYKCNKCRRVVAGESNIIPHFPRDRFSWRDKKYTRRYITANRCHRIHFIEPMSWMKSVFENPEGKLYCPNPNCQQKLGSYCWVIGCLCPCGTKVYPGFYLVPSKIDVEEVYVDEEEFDADVEEVYVDEQEVNADVMEVDADVEEVNADVVEVDADVEEVNADVVEVDADVEEVNADVVEVDSDVVEVNADVEEVKVEVEEVKVEVEEIKVEVELKVEEGELKFDEENIMEPCE